jgi:amino acid adenylation domain-containing protein
MAHHRKALHELFEEQVERTPDSVAVTDRTRQITYSELNCRSNQLARYMQKLGAHPEVRIGICMERSVDLVVGMLGILKAGAAYVPLDPYYPAERLRFILEDAQAAVLLTESQVLERLKLACPGRVLIWEQQWNLIGQERKENLATALDPENLAYLIYTSGSTGKPKAVGIRHASVDALLRWAGRVFSPEETAVVLGATSICFDLSVFEIFMPLSRGGRVKLAANALELADMAGRDQLTLVNTVPSAMTELLRMNAVPSSVRVVNLAGEALPKSLVKQIYEQTHIGRLFNLYGPSECTTYSTYSQLSPAEIDEEVSIGKSITGTHVYVLDESGELAPSGVSGELFIGGEGLARGYVGRPDLTADKFVPDPFTTKMGGRLYRTGDLVRWRATGQLDFLGRTDHQVKLRGYRVELGEIEAELEKHEQTERAVVLLREDQPGDRRLAAYIVKRNKGQELSPDRLREHLRQRLPEYMVPDTWVELERFPLSPNGKIDRQALPRPEVRVADTSHSYVSPRTDLEKRLAEVWSEMLGIDKVGVRDNFLDLGGHSLVAIRVLSRVARECGVDMHVQDLLQEPTIEALAKTVDHRARAGTGLPRLRRSEEKQAIPLSYSQQMLWLFDQLHPSAACYNITESFRIEGDLNPEALQWALTEIVRRHEALRTRLVLKKEVPVQEIDPPLEVSLPLIDLSGVEQSVRERRAKQLIVQKAQERFRLSKGPLLRALLVRCDRKQYIFMLCVHHVATDGWSQNVLWSELSSLYGGAHGKSLLAELPIQYSDYAVWQRDCLDEEDLKAHLVYWKLQLANISQIELPGDRPRPSGQTFRGAREFLQLDSALAESLKELSRTHGVTMFMVLLAAFKVFLYRYSGETDIAVGTAIADRRQVETEGLIGFFINTLVLRTNLVGNPTFASLLHRVASVALEAHRHQDVPFQHLVEHLGGRRSWNSNPLTRVMFVLENTPFAALQLAGLQVTPLPTDIGTAVYDLTLSLTEANGEFRGFVEYSTELFDRITIQRLIACYEMVLQGVAADPERHIDALAITPLAERAKALSEWNRTEAPFPIDKCLHHLFEEQAVCIPDAIAVADEQGQLTYRELNRRADQLAHYLIKMGMEAEARVGICMRRSAHLIVGILGILKAAATYVPLDPAYPAQRLSFMLEDAECRLVVTEAEVGESLPANGSRAIWMDRDWPLIKNQPFESPRAKVNSKNLAYVIYTSGSTGRPKGVQCSHRGVVNLLDDFHRRQPLRAGQRCSAWTSLSFDVSVYEIFGALRFGGTLEIVPEHQRTDARKMSEWLSTRHIASAYLPNFMLGTLCEWAARHPGKLELKLLLVGVEPIEHKLLVRLIQAIPGLKIINGYGPTEASICATLFEVEPRSFKAGPAPIGRPVANTQAYVLDQQQQPAPVGVAGELYLGGEGLARGYLNRPDLTAEKFVPNPFSPRDGARLYRTGDLVKWSADGNISFLRRADNQVKLRGHRIELEEIENMLEGYEKIDRAVVLMRKDQPGNDRLVGYVIKAPNVETLETNEVHAWLKKRLPDYMVPAIIVKMDEFPLSPNGKIDRQRLPKPDFDLIQRDYTGPTNAIERTLCAMWSDLLKLERVGIHDNFFDLGGHSLLATRMVSRLFSVFGIELPVRVLFGVPTVSEMARTIAAKQEECKAAAGIAASKPNVSVSKTLSAEQMLASLDSLSEDEVELLLIIDEPI